MSRAIETPEKVPLPFLVAAGGLIALTLALIGLARLTGEGATMVPAADPVAMRDLRFEDRPDGGVAVYTEPGARFLAEIGPGSGGFLRGTLRALVRERRQQGIQGDVPFRLMRDAGGALILADPATGRRIVLGAFGPTNAGVFAGLLDERTRP